MPSLLNRGGVWYASFHDAGRRPTQRRHSLKTRSKRTALRLLSRLDDAYRAGVWDAWSQQPDELFHADQIAAPKRLGEVAAEFVAHKKETAAPSTLNAYRSYTRLLVAVAGADAYLERISSTDVERFIHATGASGRSPSAGSKHQRMIVAQSFFSFAFARGYVKTKVTDAVTRPPKPERLPKAVTDAELDALLAAIPEGRAWTRPVFQFAALTGLRVSELCRLRWRDIDFEKRLLRIERQKNGKAQTQPFPESALYVLNAVAHHGPYVFTAPQAYAARRVSSWTKDLESVFAEARAAAGIKRPITPHGLRHRYCTKLAEAGASSFTIQAAARHGDVRTSERYVSIANDVLRAQLDAVFR